MILFFALAVLGAIAWWLSRPVGAPPPAAVPVQQESPPRRGRAVNYSGGDLAAVDATLHSVRLDFDFPPGTVKKVQPTSPGPWPLADLHLMTCTCERWQEMGASAARGTPQRLCRHLLRLLVDRVPEAERGCLEGMLADRSSMRLRTVKEVRVAGRHICWVGAEDTEPFISVYARARTKTDAEPPGTGAVRAFRLSKTGDRWAYAEAPYGAGAIKKAIAAAGLWSPGSIK
jgi:hypothetical protein